MNKWSRGLWINQRQTQIMEDTNLIARINLLMDYLPLIDDGRLETCKQVLNEALMHPAVAPFFLEAAKWRADQEFWSR
jgi:hypothetical protein